MYKLRGVICGLICVSLFSGCQAPTPRGETARRETPGEDELRERAAALWTAKAAEDWASAFQFEEPAQRERWDVEEYVSWHEEKEPFRTHAYEILAVHARDEKGWVQLRTKASVRQFPSMPAREVTRWEKWRVTDGKWYPVPTREQELYPATPAKRDAAAEAALTERFAGAWQMRHTGDWGAYYDEYVDPLDREEIAREEVIEEGARGDYLTHTVHWVEVIEDRGRVRVAYSIKTTDPTRTKVPPQEVELIEPWVKRDGQWYRSLIGQE